MPNCYGRHLGYAEGRFESCRICRGKESFKLNKKEGMLRSIQEYLDESKEPSLADNEVWLDLSEEQKKAVARLMKRKDYFVPFFSHDSHCDCCYNQGFEDGKDEAEAQMEDE